MTPSQDLFWMLQAITLGEKGRITAPPNPWVGCAIVKNQRLIGNGFSAPAGQSHAEVIALQQAGSEAKDSFVYVTLEPCSHYGKTPPCVNALIQAQVKKVFIATLDPDPRVSGRGVDALRQAGIEVEIGLAEELTKNSLAPYLYQRQTKRPFCVCKAAISIDGRIAAKDSSSQWISSESARKDVHLIRAQSQAILIGAGTATIDCPALTVRDINPPPTTPPLRVILDSTGRTPIAKPLFDLNLAPLLIFTTSRCSEDKILAWQAAGAEVFVATQDASQRVDIQEVLQYLGERGILQVLVEGGSEMLARFMKEKLYQQFVLYMGNVILGDEGRPLFQHWSIPSIEKAPRLQLLKTAQFDQTVRLDFMADTIKDSLDKLIRDDRY